MGRGKFSSGIVARWEKAFRNQEWLAEEADLEEVTGQPAIVG
jgi:hypothetical protein